MMERSVLACLATLLMGCATLESTVVAVDEALYEAVDSHPVTGQPMFNVVSEPKEIATAKHFVDRVRSELVAAGNGFDQPSHRLRQIERVFGRLLSVAHRQHLPWRVHLADHPMSNAFTPGGGEVVVEDLYGNIPTEGSIRGFPHHTHSALVDALDDAVVQQVLAGPDSHI